VPADWLIGTAAPDPHFLSLVLIASITMPPTAITTVRSTFNQFIGPPNARFQPDVERSESKMDLQKLKCPTHWIIPIILALKGEG